MPTHLRASTRIAILVLAGGLALGGCGGSGSESADASQSGNASASAGESALPADTQAKLQAVLDDTRAAMGFPGVQAGVWTPDGEWTGVSGTAGEGETRPPEPADHTRIGSLTKTFTGTVILQLAEEGKVSLDDPISKYVPDMPNGDTATLANLANMTSGIPPYTPTATGPSFPSQQEFIDAYFADPYSVWTPQQLVDIVKGQPPMFAAGEQMFYSNTNTVLLGMVIEQVTGQSIEEVFKAKIYEPLGMTQTSFPGDSADLPTPYLSGLTEQGDPQGEPKDATDWNPSWGFTAGAAISTLEDLHRWGVALGTGEGILQPEMQAERMKSFDTTVAGNSPDRSYGLGAARTDGWIGHVGTLPGYNTSVQYDPQSKTTIVIMVNSDVPKDNKLPDAKVFGGMVEALG
jgi:D-alanyl-D-alanine carboxypeptidase